MSVDLKESISSAMSWYESAGFSLPLSLLLEAKKAGVEVKGFLSYSALRADYWARVYDSVEVYLDGSKPITLYRNSMLNLMRDYFQQAAEIGYEDGGASLPLDSETQSLVDGRIASEEGNIQDLFPNLRDNSIPDYAAEAMSRADGYANTLDSLYDLGKIAAAMNKDLTFGGDDGAESCIDCLTMKGQRNPARWWIDNDMVPRPGNKNYECRNYSGCQHGLYDDDGNLFTQ